MRQTEFLLLVEGEPGAAGGRLAVGQAFRFVVLSAVTQQRAVQTFALQRTLF
jgi:hypothetical protein